MDIKPLSESVAFELHEEWKRNRLEKGKFEPLWKRIKNKEFINSLNQKDELPKYIRKDEKGYEIDLTRAYFTQLSPDLQNEYKQIADLVSGIVVNENHTVLPIDEIRQKILKLQLKIHPSLKKGPLGKPYNELSWDTQDMLIRPYLIAVGLYSAGIESYCYMNSLDSVIEQLAEEKAKGNDVCYMYHDHLLFSALDNRETCYLKVTGKTEKEYYDDLRKEAEESKKRMEKNKAEVKSKIPEWQKRGEAFIYPENKEKWYECVEGRAADIYYGEDLVNALDVMEALDSGKTIEEATKVANNFDHTGGTWAMMMAVVTTFSKRGPEFYRAINDGEIDEETELYLQQLERENNYYKAIHSKNSPNLIK